jgi:hypothetical protein
MDALDIRHIASGIQADIYTFTLPPTSLPGSAGDEEGELIRLLESVDLRSEAPPLKPTATPAPFDLPIDDVEGSLEPTGGQREGCSKSGGRVLAVKVVSAGKDGVMPRLRPHNVKVEAELLRQLDHPHVRDVGIQAWHRIRRQLIRRSCICWHTATMPCDPNTSSSCHTCDKHLGNGSLMLRYCSSWTEASLNLLKAAGPASRRS